MPPEQWQHYFLLRHVTEKNFSKSKKVYTAFVDYKTAFDTIPRRLLLHKLNKIGVPLSAINVINSMYSGTESAVYLPIGITDTFHQYVGLKQDCPLSPLLFNIYIHDLEDFLKKDNHGISIGNKNIKAPLCRRCCTDGE